MGLTRGVSESSVEGICLEIMQSSALLHNSKVTKICLFSAILMIEIFI
jgi:hypothetical protein